MIIRRAYKFRLKISKTNAIKLSQITGSTRFVWNKALAIQKDKLEKKEKILTYNEMSALLTQWRKEEETLFLAENSYDSQQQKLRDLNRAIWDGLDKKIDKQFPRFKKKGRQDSFRCVGKKQFDLADDKVRVPKVGWLKFRKSRDIVGAPKNVTISKHADHWYVSIQTEFEITDPIHGSRNSIGIDMGIAKFATCSDGTSIDPLNSFRNIENKLAKEQRKLSRKVKFSNNWKKQNKKIQRIHKKVADARKDFLHKTSTKITNENQVVIVEDLKTSNMSKSAKGTKEFPGKNVKTKSGLNKSILDQGWYEFSRQLEYKLKWKGGRFIKVDPKYTSQRCSSCGTVSKESRLSQSKFFCTKCSHSLNADLNASLNILAVGQTVIACGDISSVTN